MLLFAYTNYIEIIFVAEWVTEFGIKFQLALRYVVNAKVDSYFGLKLTEMETWALTGNN